MRAVDQKPFIFRLIRANYTTSDASRIKTMSLVPRPFAASPGFRILRRSRETTRELRRTRPRTGRRPATPPQVAVRGPGGDADAVRTPIRRAAPADWALRPMRAVALPLLRAFAPVLLPSSHGAVPASRWRQRRGWASRLFFAPCVRPPGTAPAATPPSPLPPHL